MTSLKLFLSAIAMSTATLANAGEKTEMDPVANVVVPLFDAVANEDLAAAGAFLVDGAPIYAMFNPNGQTDAASIRTFPATAYFQLVARNYENIVFTDRTYSIAEEGRTVWMEANGDLRLEASGAPYRNRYVFKISLNEVGKVLEIREWVNTVTLTQQGIAARR